MLDSIRLQNFRSYEDASFEFDSGVNIIVGPNASGKTNLIEAVLVSARGSSFRAKDMELVSFGKPWTRIDCRYGALDRVVKLEVKGLVINKNFEIDGQVLQRLSPQKTIAAVLFEPNHLLMVAGPPELRRNFIDDVIEQTQPGYATTRRAYRRALSQRNALLKRGYGVAKPQIFVWNLRISELGGKIATERTSLIERFNQSATMTYRNLTGTKSEIQISYQSPIRAEQYETGLLKKLETNLERDCLIGYTTAGPHRDDVSLKLNGKPAESSASRGESRSLVLMLKKMELDALEAFHGASPLLLLDDVFSELDGKRRHAITEHLQPYQTFITTTDADIVVKNFAKSSNVIALT